MRRAHRMASRLCSARPSKRLMAPALRVAAERAYIDQLDAPIFGRIGMARLEQLLFSHTDGLNARRADAERSDKRIADRIGALLTELEVIFAAADRVGMPDDQETVTLQMRMIERVSHQAQGSIRVRIDARRIE